MTYRAAIRLSASMLVPAILAGTAQAQSLSGREPPQAVEAAVQAREAGLEDIIVTARKRTERLQDVPLSVTGISAATIAQRDITTVERLNGLAPNLGLERAGGPTTSGIILNIRGIGGSDSTGASDYPVATYVDGVLVSRPNAILFDLVELERVEVLRGPQGTLFGRNTTGGALNIFTKAPAETFGVEQKLTYGTFNLFKSRTTIDTGDLGNSGIFAKVAYSHEEIDGYIDNPLTRRSKAPGARNSESGYVSIHGAVAPKFTFDLRADYTNSKAVPVHQQLAYINPLQLAYFSQSPNFGGASLVVDPERRGTLAVADQPPGKSEIWGGALTVSYDVSDALALKSIVGYRRFNEKQAINLDGQGALRGQLIGNSVARVHLFDFVDPVISKDRQFTWELQALGDLGDINYVAGLYYFDENYKSISTQRLTAVVNLGAQGLRGVNVVSLRDYRQTSKSYAAFGQLSYKPSFLEKLELTLGLRYTEDKKALRQANATNGVLLAPGADSKRWNNLSGAASISYQWTDDLMTYARVANAYRAGGFDAGGAGRPNGYDPEKATAYEIGFKSDLLGRHLRFNASAFYTDYSDLQITQFTAGTNGGRSNTVNAGKASFAGFEVEITATPTDRLTLNGAFGYVDATYKHYLFRDPISNQIIDVADEVRLPHAPKTTFNLGAALDVAEFSFGSLHARVDYSFQGRRWRFPLDRVNPYNPQIRSNQRNDLSARISLREIPLSVRSSMTVELYGENLLNQDQRIGAVDFGALGFATITWGPKRQLGVSATVAF